ncbi:MAG: sugar phosphate isomerase/epimerase [Lachnospiraceae bacterium]|nr:sugar phosphate isomerase/epimerase [Lachnospiraceae bacterium]
MLRKCEMKISVFYDHILQAAEQTGKPLPALLFEVREAGIEAVEMRLSCLLENETVLGLLKEAGLSISCLYEFYEMEKGIASPVEEQHVLAACAAGAERIIVVPGFLKGREIEERKACAGSAEETAAYMEKSVSIRHMAEGLARMTALGRKYGITVTVEDFDDAASPLNGKYGILWFLKEVLYLKFTLDMGNFAHADEDMLAAAALLEPYIVHVHCKDRGVAASKKQGGVNRGLLPVAVGDGYIPIGMMVKELIRKGYNGYFAIEHFDAPNQEESILRSAAYLRRIAKETVEKE